MNQHDLVRIIERALIYKLNDGGDIPVAIDCLLEDVRKTLECDPRFSRLSYREFDVLFAAFADGARRLLDVYLRIEWDNAAQHIDWDYAARNVTEAVIDETSQEFDPDAGGAP
jgi:hypothetical protein